MSETFNYTYSAKQNDEVKKIREKYISKSNEESNYEKIKRLDANSTRGGTKSKRRNIEIMRRRIERRQLKMSKIQKTGEQIE